MSTVNIHVYYWRVRAYNASEAIAHAVSIRYSRPLLLPRSGIPSVGLNQTEFFPLIYHRLDKWFHDVVVEFIQTRVVFGVGRCPVDQDSQWWCNCPARW